MPASSDIFFCRPVILSSQGEGDLVEGLRRTWTGHYRAADVDRLLMKLRCDYENRLKEQKQRILELRSENKALREQIKKYQENAQYVSRFIARPSKPKMIVEQAEMKR